MSTTRPFISAAPVEPRSSWLLRAAFAVVGLTLVVEGVIVLGLVAYTVLLVREEPAAVVEQPAPEALERAAVPVDADPLAEGGDVWQGHGPVNVLLLGTDHDVCADANVTINKADTIILVRIDPADRSARMMSLPRDLLVQIPQAGPKKLTMAHYFGELWDYEPDGGPGLVKVVLRDNFQLPVHRFVRIDFDGFERIVDAIGPITVDVPPNANDPSVGLYDESYPGENCAYTTISFPPGVQEMDGEHALQYARSRYSTSDFDRSRRQMQVLMAIRERMLRPGILMDLHRLIPSLLDSVDTDLSVPEIISLGRVARGIGPERIERLPIDENVVYDDMMVIDNTSQSILQRKPDAWQALRNRFLGIGDAVTTSDTDGDTATAPDGDTATAPDGDTATAPDGDTATAPDAGAGEPAAPDASLP